MYEGSGTHIKTSWQSLWSDWKSETDETDGACEIYKMFRMSEFVNTSEESKTSEIHVVSEKGEALSYMEWLGGVNSKLNVSFIFSTTAIHLNWINHCSEV